MNQERISQLNSTTASNYVLSCLMRNPLLLQEEQYAFTPDDFTGEIRTIVFYAIFNMGQKGAERIEPLDIEVYLKAAAPSHFDFYEKNKGSEFVRQTYRLTENSDCSQFESMYELVKKFSILRDLERNGVDTTRFYDTKNILNQQAEQEKLRKISLKSIIESVNKTIVSIEDKHIGKDEGNQHTAADGMMALMKELRAHPEVGRPIDGDIINFASRGARLGKFYLYSAPSGGGKTRFLVGNACSLSMPHLNEKGEIEITGPADGSGYAKVCYIATEQQFDEIQTLIMAHVSGVNEEKILTSTCTADDWKRIEKANEIIEKYANNLIIDCIPDPSIALLKARLAKYAVQYGIEYFFYDYIFSSPGLVNEFAGSDLREDVVLMMLSNSLKEFAMNYNIFLMSATQLNDGWSKREVGARDQNCIRGSKAIPDKIDVGLIGVRTPEEERKQIEAIWQEVKRLLTGKVPKIALEKGPNITVDIYKNRRGAKSAVKVFRYFDFETCRAYDLFCTDVSYKKVENIGTFEYETHCIDFLNLQLLKVSNEEGK